LTIDNLGREEAIVYDFCTEPLEHHRVSDTTCQACKNQLGELPR
jgi:hypothetical protein